MLGTKHIEEEIWKLKNQDKPKIKDNTLPPNNIDAPIDQFNLDDAKKYRFVKHNMELEELAEATQYMRELFEKEIKNGNVPSSMSYSEWLERLRTKLNAGGPVKNRPKEPAGVKKIDLMPDFHNLMDMLSKMSPQERESINWLVEKTFGKKR